MPMTRHKTSTVRKPHSCADTERPGQNEWQRGVGNQDLLFSYAALVPGAQIGRLQKSISICCMDTKWPMHWVLVLRDTTLDCWAHIRF